MCGFFSGRWSSVRQEKVAEGELLNNVYPFGDTLGSIKSPLPCCGEVHCSFTGCIERVIATLPYVRTRQKAGTALAYNNSACRGELAAVEFDTEMLWL